jgi:hypothetical protein
MAADVLSDLLKTVRLTGAAFFEIAAEAPWAIASPPREMILRRILPYADHLIAYHAVTLGRCVANVAGSPPVELEAGEIIVFTNGQVQVACDQAKNGGARLAGIEPPKFEDNETSIDQLKERIAKTIAFVKTLDAKAIDASLDREITFPLGPTNKGHMRGADYLNHFVLPNFYFHLTAAYAIMRHCGVDVGKRDFLGAIPLRLT